MRRATVLALTGLLAACAGDSPPVPPPAVAVVAEQGAPAVAVSQARLAVAETLTALRLTRAALLQEAMATPPDDPRRAVLADRATRLKRLEADLVAVQDTLRATTDAQSLAHAHAAAEMAQALMGRIAR